MPAPGSLRYHRTPLPIVSEVMPGGPVTVKLAVFNHQAPVVTRYIHIFDRSDIPPNGSRPLIEFTIYPNGMVSYTPAFDGRKFSRGFVVCLSSTPTVYTPSAAAELTYQVEGIDV